MDLIDKANELLRQKKFGELDLVIEELSESDPKVAKELSLQKWADLGDQKELEKTFDEYLEEYPDIPTSNRIVAAQLKYDLGKYEEAMKIVNNVFLDEPNNFSAGELNYACSVNIKQHQQALDIATNMVSEAIRLEQPEEVIANYRRNQLVATTLVGRFEDTLKLWDEIEPLFDRFSNNRDAVTYACLVKSLDCVGRHAEALEVIKNNGLDSEAYEASTSSELELIIPQVYLNNDLVDESFERYRKLITKYADSAEPKWNFSLALVATGKLQEGFDLMEIRWDWKDFPSKKRKFSSPKYEGEDLEGKTILIWGEQGVGDQLLYLTLLPFILKKNPKEVTVEVSHKLIKLVKEWYPEVKVRGDDVVDTVGQSVYDRLDFQTPAGSLMRLVIKEHGDLPNDHRFMRIKPEARSAFLPKHLLNKRVIVGLSWRSSLLTEQRLFNYMSVDAAAVIVESCPDDIGFIALQYAMNEEEKETLRKYPNVLVPDDDFYEDVYSNGYYTGCCDCVVTAGTVTVQLAGMFNVPCLTWLPRRDWVLFGRDHYPWFKNTLVVRGEAAWDQDAMLTELIRKLRILLRLDEKTLH